MDRILVQILVIVGRNRGENPLGRIGKGSWATNIGPGLVDPNCELSMRNKKGKQVHIPVPRLHVPATKGEDETCADRLC
jgi:hypothetical protein